MDTKIAIVRGIGDIKPMLKVNPLTKTAGEFLLELAHQRLDIFEQVEPEKAKIYRKGKSMIINTLYNAKGQGVHGHTPYLGTIDKDLEFVADAITKAAKRTNYAAAAAYVGRKDLSKGFNFDVDRVGFEVFSTMDELRKINCIDRFWDGQQGEYVETVNYNCVAVHQFFYGLNIHLPKSAHHAIYNFIVNANAANITQTAGVKSVQHKQVIAELVRAGQVATDLMTSWQKNCIIWHNSEKGWAGIGTPEDVISYLQANTDFDIVAFFDANRNNINPFPIIAFCWAMVAAIVAIAGLIQVTRDKEPTAFSYLAGLSTSAFAGSGTDFKKTGGGGGGANPLELACNATGGTWNRVTNTCDRSGGGGTGGGGTGGGGTGTETGGGIMEWIKENPLTSALIGGGVALTLGGAFKNK